MDQIRTMQDDLKKASQSPKDVAAAFNSNVSSNTQSSPVKTPTPPPNLPVTDSVKQENKPSAPSLVSPPPISRPPLSSSPVSVPKFMPSPNAKPGLSLEKENIFKSSEPSAPPKPLAPSPVPSAPLAVQTVSKPEYSSFSSPVFKYVIIGIIILLVVGGGTFGYFVFFNSSSNNQSTNTNSNNTNTGENSAVVPESLIPIDSTVDVTVSAEQDLGVAIKEDLSSLEMDTGSYARILVYQEDTLLSLESFLSALKITIPANVKSLLNNDYTFFVYNQKEGFRYGLVIGSTGSLTEAIKSWEERMFQDLSFLYIEGNPQVVENKFSENNTYSTKIHYLNLPDHQTSLDYAINNVLFIIATSKDSMIDLVKKL